MAASTSHCACGAEWVTVTPAGNTCQRRHFTPRFKGRLVAGRAPGEASSGEAPGPPAQQAAIQQPHAPAVSALLVKSLADVEAKPVTWLWHGWLAAGKVHVLGGHAGDGKSTLTAWLAAVSSTGAQFPDGTTAPKLRTLFLLAEDALDDTLRPRLDLHGADVAMVDAIEAVREPDGAEAPFNLLRHLPLLETHIQARGVGLVVIDPLTSFLPGRDRNSEGDVRDALTPLARLADHTGVAVLAVMHIGKPSGTNRRPVQQLLGSTAFGAVARLVWMVAPTSPDPAETHRVLAVVKSNLALKPPALEWSRAEDAAIVWHGPTTLDVGELLGSAPPQPRADAEGFLRDALAAGPVLATTVKSQAQAAGIAYATLRRAQDALGVEAFKQPGMMAGRWWWRLPNGSSKVLTPEDAQVSTFDESTFEESATRNGPIGPHPNTGAKMLTAPNSEHIPAPEDAHLPGIGVSIFDASSYEEGVV